jgi:hypothetical protein
MNIPAPLPPYISAKFNQIAAQKTEIETQMNKLSDCNAESDYKVLSHRIQTLLSDFQRAIDNMLVASQETASSVNGKSILYTLGNYESDLKR